MKTSRKIFCWIIVFAMFLTIMAPVFAATDYGITWDISEDGVLTISAYGELKQNPWVDDAEKVKKIIISEGVTVLGDHAFCACENLEEVILPEGLEKIGDHVFPRSPYFKEIYFPASVTQIDSTAFFSCNALERIVVSPDNPYYTTDDRGVLYNKDMTFLLCAPQGLTGSYTIPDTVKHIGGNYVRRYMSPDGLSEWQFSDSYYAFQDCKKVTEILIPNSVEHIGEWAFDDCDSLTEITIPDSVRSLDARAFASCTGLTKLHIGSGVKSIGEACFVNCISLLELTIPSNVYEIGEAGFAGCKSIEKIVFEEGIQKIGKDAFGSCYNLKEIQLPSTIQKITDEMLRDCTSLKSITIPKNVTHIGAWAFDGCEVLRDITFEGEAPTFGQVAFISKTLYFHYPEGVESWDAIVGTKAGLQAKINWVPYTPSDDESTELPLHTLSWCRRELVGAEKYMEWELTSDGVLTFRGTFNFTDDYCGYGGPRDSVKKIVIGDGVKIVAGLEGMPLLEEVVLPEGLRYITANSFRNCPKLEEINIPKSVAYIDSKAFDGCTGLKAFRVAEGNRAYASDESGVLFNGDMTMLLMAPEGFSGSYQVPEGVRSIGGMVNYGYLEDGNKYYGDVNYYGFRNRNRLTQIKLNQDLNTIAPYAFASCVSLTHLTLPEGFTELGDYAFESCSALVKVVFPESLKTLGNYAFQNCDRLTQISMSSGLKKISEGCFAFCDGMKEITIPGTVEEIGKFAFSNCTGLEKLVLEDGIVDIKENAFSNCTSLSQVRLSATVTTLRYWFDGCTMLETITIPATVSEMGYIPFYRCESLKEVIFEGSWPDIKSSSFADTEITIYYPQGDQTWEDGLNEHSWLREAYNCVPYELHNWVEATCDSAKVCADCGKVSGEPLGHDWQEATCLTAKTCGRCGLAEGEALGHSWVEAGCTAPKTCHRCGLTEGEALGHNFVEEICTRCGRPDIPGILGDVDGNGKLSYNDALLVLRASIKLVDLTAEQKLLGDFDGNGILNYNDALAILRASIGL